MTQESTQRAGTADGPMEIYDVAPEIVRYPGAEHGFHCDVRASYDEAAAKDAWQRTLEWLRRHLAR